MVLKNRGIDQNVYLIVIGLLLVLLATVVIIFTFGRPDAVPTATELPSGNISTSVPIVNIPASRSGALSFSIEQNLSSPPQSLAGQIYDRSVVSVVVDAPDGASVLAELGVVTESGFRDWTVSLPGSFRLGENSFAIRLRFSDGTEEVSNYTVNVSSIRQDSTSERLSVSWLEQPVRRDVYAVFSPERYSTFQSAVGTEVAGASGAWKLGTVDGGAYAGQVVYMVMTGYCAAEMGCSIGEYRVLVDLAGQVSLLTRHSDTVAAAEVPLFDKELPQVEIPDLIRPSEFTFRGLTFREFGTSFFGRVESWFTDQELVVVDQHPQYGAVYTTPPTFDPEGGFSVTNAFYLRLPDNRVRSFRFRIPFVRDERIPEISWNDGTQNAIDYSWTDIGGCGATNATAVRAESFVRPAERLVAAGRTRTGDTVYVLKDNQDVEYRKLYETATAYVPQGETPLTFEAFVAGRPLFYWKDPFNRWVRFTRLDTLPAVECGKPVIYLYPEKEMSVSVRVGLKGNMTVSEPPHGTTGWKVTARPDGYVVNAADGKTYPNLFWEGTGVGYQTPKQGFVVKTAEADAWLTNTLATIGFTERESAEFREFWVPRLPKMPYTFITFVPQADFDRDAPLMISPRPDKVYRVFMEYRGLEAPISVKPLALPKIERTGFTVVEWGGALKK
ncbi:MAG: hypothetical protein AAB974_02065 [Patescibacteria group bacterium]